MTDIKVKTLSVPKTARNKRIYSGSITRSYSESVSVGSSYVPRSGILSYDNGDFSTRTISVEFTNPFSDVPVGWVKCYRYESRDGGGVYEANAVIYLSDSDWKTADGFTIYIEDYESLNGLFIEYTFNERSYE